MSELVPQPPELGPNEIHLWLVSLHSALPLPLADPDTFLSSDEKNRAERLRIPEKRLQFVLGRNLLRCILAGYLSQPPRSLVFRYGPYGKPLDFPLSDGRRLHYNLSHSKDWLVLAVTLDRCIGIDLEWQNPHLDILSVAQRFFAPDETEWLVRRPADLKRQDFYNIWTRKEAFLKASGDGFNLPSNSFSLPLRPVLVPGHLAKFSFRNETWFLGDFQTPLYYFGSLVADRRWDSFNYLDFQS